MHVKTEKAERTEKADDNIQKIDIAERKYYNL